MSSGDDRPGSPAVPPAAGARNGLVRTVFDGLDRAGVRWALLRGRATVDLPGGDVDLLVSADDLDSFEDVVFELGAFVLPRVRVPGSWSRAVLRHSWHRFYVLSDRSSEVPVKLDVVTQLVYNKQLKLASGLEHGCLDRRIDDDGVQVLDPTDTFWTVLMHCLLDKQRVTAQRAGDLESVVAAVRRPSPGEEFFESLCPPSCSPDEVLALVRNGDWDSLADVGRLILRAAGKPDADPPHSPAAPPQAGPPTDRMVAQVTRGLRAAAVSAFPVVWRRSGLGVVPRVLDIVEGGAVDATVLLLRRRPARCEVYLLTTEEQRAALGPLLRDEHYVAAGGCWHRLSATGLERVHLVTPEELRLTTESADRLRATSRPMAGRTHCRRAVGAGPWLHALGLRGELSDTS